MAGTGGFAVRRSHGGDRFYNPPAMRRHQQLLVQQQLQQQQLQHHQVMATAPENRTDSGDDSMTTLPKMPLACSSSPTNLDSLVDSVTPIVPAQYSSEVNGRGWRSREAGLRPFYRLEDLWASLKQWSVYGVEVPLLLNGKDSIKQYYVPFLSGIQLYIDPHKPPSKIRRPGEDRDTESSRGTSSGGSSDYEADTRITHVRDGSSNQQNMVNLNSQRLNSLSLRDKCGDEGETSNSSGLLVFEYMEHEQPHFRKPLTDKIQILESQFPELSLYRSCDLLPSSWISIAWYPIYRIPMGSTLKDLDASFLTIHPLSTNSNSCQPHGASCGRTVNGLTGASSKICLTGASSKISLPVIGLASYKYKGSMLTPCGPQECEKEKSLFEATNNWLKELQVVLPDFQFFRSHYSPWR